LDQQQCNSTLMTPAQGPQNSVSGNLWPPVKYPT
jgi:hypothetical protein